MSAENNYKFKVSARTGRLIGRENIANERAAITELVKNSYDADAEYCFVLFKKRYNKIPSTLTLSEGQSLAKCFKPFSSVFRERDGIYVLKSPLKQDELEQLQQALGSIADLWVIDTGTGMNEHTIKYSWMVIGTDEKQINHTSKRGRVLSGSKGIGRFALDRLGTRSNLFSKVSENDESISWTVNWDDFEGAGKTVDQVEATVTKQFENLKDHILKNGLEDLLPSKGPQLDKSEIEPICYSSGTAIKIENLRDNWTQNDVEKLKKLLEALAPPKEQKSFSIFVADERTPEINEWVDNFPPDEFDYKMEAEVKKDGSIAIALYRNEFDIGKIPEEFFDYKEMQEHPFTKEDIQAGKVNIASSIGKLIRSQQPEKIEPYKALGPFKFTLYFSKLQLSKESEKLAQKNFDPTRRAQWLGVNAGIKIYRDDIMVRPFGEFDSGSFDWLSLGRRVSTNPAALTRIGGWRMNPQNAAGTVSITRENNQSLEDQSNREGIADSLSFSRFRELIIRLISVLEYDRSYIFHFIKKASDQHDKRQQAVQEARDVVYSRSEKSGNKEGSQEAPTSEDFETVRIGFERLEDILKERDEEIQLLRAMATQGTVMIAFTHELKSVLSELNGRTNRLRSAIHRISDEEKLGSIDERLSPFRLLDLQDSTDEKVINWIRFASTSITPKKRRRKKIDLNQYFQGFRDQWTSFLDSKGIQLNIAVEENTDKLLAHEIDLDSIFFNLVVNSVEEFISSTVKVRQIGINVKSGSQNELIFTYKDTGPGLSLHFNVPEDIFKFGVSSKPNIGGDSDFATGTGIGMWILNGVVTDVYNGHVKLLSKMAEPNFMIEISLPTK